MNRLNALEDKDFQTGFFKRKKSKKSCLPKTQQRSEKK